MIETPHMVEIDGDEVRMVSVNGRQRIGIHCGELGIAISADAMILSLTIPGSRRAIFQSLTPALARAMAASLVASADKIERGEDL